MCTARFTDGRKPYFRDKNHQSFLFARCSARSAVGRKRDFRSFRTKFGSHLYLPVVVLVPQADGNVVSIVSVLKFCSDLYFFVVLPIRRTYERKLHFRDRTRQSFVFVRCTVHRADGRINRSRH